MKLTRLKMTLLVLLTITLTACQTAKPIIEQRIAPIKPDITAISHEGMVCFSEDDAKELFFYILELEKGYE